MFIHLAEMGYSPVALYKDKKIPIIKGWQKFSEQMPSKELIDAWQKDKDKFNIGVVCGRASNLIAIDIDVDDEELYKIVPLSPIRKRGGKGEVRFFRFCEDQKIRHFADILGNGVLDILSTGSQTVLPPSIHPDTKKPYFWLTDDTLYNMRAEDLPVFTTDWFTEMDQWLNRRNQKIQQTTGITAIDTDFKMSGSGNRNNKLKAMVTAMRVRGCEEREVIDEIYKHDLERHMPPLFSDPKENKRYANEDDAYTNAARFYSSVNNFLITSGVIKYKKSSPEIVIDFDDAAIEEAKKTAFKSLPYPRARGMMGKFQELCELKSAGKQEATSLGGAIALMSAIASNRFVTKFRDLTTCPNTYVINLGYSSFGKETAQDLVNTLLCDSGLLGSGNYKSAVSVIMNLPKQQERLDVIDECSSILSAMGSKDGYASQIVELLSELFTKGSSKYSGQTSMTNGDRFGACYNPHISIIGSTTPKGFRTSVNKDVAAKGLLPRMLLFFQDNIGSYDGRKDRSMVVPMTEELESFVNKVLSIEKIVHPDFNDVNIISPRQDKDGKDISQGVRYKHTIILMTDETHDAWMNYEEKCHYEKIKDPEGFESAFIGRFAELAAKLALLDTISLNRNMIEPDSLAWAISVVETQWHNSKPLYEVAHAESVEESQLIRVLNFIKSVGIVDKTSIARKFQFLGTRKFNEAINTLIETDQIVASQKSKNGAGRPKTYYQSVTRGVN